MRTALLSATFLGVEAADQLSTALGMARQAGAELVVLPELPCNSWCPATPAVDAADAEPPFGRRHQLQSSAARDAGVGLVGGAIVFDRMGELVHSYRKIHIPQEPGFFEQDHYAAGEQAPRRIDAFGVPIGVQICSDLNRPFGCNLLAAQGAVAVLAPRATEAATFDRWELVIRANAMTSCCYVLSVNRPGPESGVELGGPSIAVAPDGEVLIQSEDELVIVDLRSERVDQARRSYPGYLAVPTELYAEGWRTASR
jgi:N-carbamoylputrescine amidase